MRAYYSTPACCNPLFPPIASRISAVSAAVSGPFVSPSTEGAPASHTAITQDSPSCLLLLRTTCLSRPPVGQQGTILRSSRHSSATSIGSAIRALPPSRSRKGGADDQPRRPQGPFVSRDGASSGNGHSDATVPSTKLIDPPGYRSGCRTSSSSWRVSSSTNPRRSRTSAQRWPATPTEPACSRSPSPTCV